MEPLTPDEVVLSRRIYDEAEHGDRRFFDNLTEHERQMVVPVLLDLPNSGELYRMLWELDYVRIPISPEEFITSEYYLGSLAKVNPVTKTRPLFEVWQKELTYVLDPKNQIHEWIITGGKGSGKTTAAEVAQMYKLYFLSCLRNPYDYFRLADVQLIVFMLFSLTQKKAETAIYDSFKRLLDNSPYFVDIYPPRRNKRKDPRLYQTEVSFPKGILVTTGSETQHALSYSIYSGILDEVNFRGRKTMDESEDPNSAMKLYEEVASRIASRYVGHTPGILCTVSSKQSTTDFIDRHIERSKGKDHVWISDFKLWDAKPQEYTFSGKRFFVLVGSSPSSSRVIPLTSDEDKKYRSLFETGSKEAGRLSDEKLPDNIMSVPEEFEIFFQRDINTALRDLAGISTSPLQRLFEDPSVLGRGLDERESPFTEETIYLGVLGGKKLAGFYKREQVTSFDGLTRRPIYYPAATRFIHVDLAKGRRDSVGLAMGCVSKVVNTTVLDEKQQPTLLPRPEIFVDFVIRLRAPQGDEVFFDEIRQFIIWLRDSCNYPIGMVTYDKYASVDSLQLLQKSNIRTELLSVDRTDGPYLLLKETIVEDRFRCYNYVPMYQEMRDLVWNVSQRSVDHPPATPSGYRGCFSGDTKVALAAGREVSIKTLAESGKQYYVYAINPNTYRVEPALARARFTKVSKTLDITLDNGERIRATPDHLFMARDGSYKEAQALVHGDALMPLYRKLDRNGYEQVYCPGDRVFVKTHVRFGKARPWREVHHKNSNKRDNRPSNLVNLTPKEHRLLHKASKREYMLRRHKTDSEYVQRLREGHRLYIESDHGKQLQSDVLKRLWQNPDFRARCLNRISDIGKCTGRVNITKYNKSDAHRKVASRVGKSTILFAIEAQRRNDVTKEKCEALRQQGYFNPQIAAAFGCSVGTVEHRLKGTKFPSPYVNRSRLNHKVVSVESGPEVEVYDLSVPGYENFALSSGVFVHNSKDPSDAVCGVVTHCTNRFADLMNKKKLPGVRTPTPAITGISGPRPSPAGVASEKDSWVVDNKPDVFSPEITRIEPR